MPLTQQPEIISIILDSDDDELDESGPAPSSRSYRGVVQNPLYKHIISQTEKASSENSTTQTDSASTAIETNTSEVEDPEAIVIDIENDAERIEAGPSSVATNNEEDILLVDECDEAQSNEDTNENVTVQEVTSSTTINEDHRNVPSTSSCSNNNDDDIEVIEPDSVNISEDIVAKETASSTQNMEHGIDPSMLSDSDNNDDDIEVIEPDSVNISENNLAKETASSSTQNRIIRSRRSTHSSSSITVDDEIDRDKPGPSGISSSVLNNKDKEDVVVIHSEEILSSKYSDTKDETSSIIVNDDDIMIVEDDDEDYIVDSMTSIIKQEDDNNINIQCNVTTCDKSTSTEPLERSDPTYEAEDDLIFIKPIIEEIRYKSVNDNMYICLVCKRLFDNIALMMTHLKIHDEKSRLCYRCGLLFDTFPNTLKHMDMCIPGKKYKTPIRRCSLCKFKALTHNSMRDHLYYVHGNKKFICNVCNISFYNPDHLRTHVQVEHRNYYKCNICHIEIMFPYFDSHMRIHFLSTINENTPKCTFCCEALPFSDDEVRTHFESRTHNYNETLWKIRNRISEFTCLCCFTPVKFRRFYDYSLHLKTHGYLKMNMDEVIAACLSLQNSQHLPFPRAIRPANTFSRITHSTPYFKKKRIIRDGKLAGRIKCELSDPGFGDSTVKTEDSTLSSEYEIKTEYSSNEERSTMSQTADHIKTEGMETNEADDYDTLPVEIKTEAVHY